MCATLRPHSCTLGRNHSIRFSTLLVLLYVCCPAFYQPSLPFEAMIRKTTTCALIIKHLETNFAWDFDAVKMSFCTKKEVGCGDRLLKFTYFPCAEGGDQKLALISLHWQYQVLTELALISNGNVAFLRQWYAYYHVKSVSIDISSSNHFQSSLTCLLKI